MTLIRALNPLLTLTIPDSWSGWTHQGTVYQRDAHGFIRYQLGRRWVTVAPLSQA